MSRKKKNSHKDQDLFLKAIVQVLVGVTTGILLKLINMLFDH